MAPELAITGLSEADLAKFAAIGIAIGAVVYAVGKHLLASLARTIWLVVALSMGQLIIANNQALMSALQTGQSLFTSPASQEAICELYTKQADAGDLLCRSGS